MKKIFIIILLFIFSVQCAAASEQIQANATLGLKDCIEIALKNSPKINISKNTAAIAKSRVGQAKSDYFPTLGASTGYIGQNNSGTYMSNVDNYYSADVSLNQLIYNFGKTQAHVNMEKFNTIASKYDYENTVLQTVNEVKRAYYAVLAAQASKEVALANVMINERQHTRIKAFFEEGLKSKIDLVNAEVYVSDSKIELVNAENTYQNALVKLNNSMFVANAPAYSIKNTETFNIKNDYASVNFFDVADIKALDIPQVHEQSAVLTSGIEKTDILENYTFKPYDLTFEKSVEIANQMRPDLKSYLAAQKAMEESLKYVQREYFPSLNGSVSYGYRNMGSYTNNGFNYQASLDIPLINAMNTKCKIDEAKAQLRIAQENVDLIKQNIYFEVQTAYIDMKQIEKRIPLMEQKVRQTLENFELADGRYAVGLGNFIELQDARANYNSAQHSFIQAVYDYNAARVALQTAMGET